MIAMFATICERCSRRSPEYASWPHCRNCGDEVCPQCSTNPGTENRTKGGSGDPEYDVEVEVCDCLECLAEICPACDGSGLLTDENGVQHDDVCPQCQGFNFAEERERALAR